MTPAENGKPLLRWIDSGDPDLVPVMMADARSTAASYFGVPLRGDSASVSFQDETGSPVTDQMILECSKETGTHFHRCLGNITPFDVCEFIDEINITTRVETNSSGAMQKYTTVVTPEGEMSEVFLTPPDSPACWTEHFVKDEQNLAALAYLIEKAAQAAVENESVRQNVTEKFRAEAAKWPSHVPLYVVAGVPAFALTCNLYTDPATAFYLLADHRDVMERLFDAQARSNAVWVQCGADAGADYVLGAINGLELYSPQIYERYFIPQACALHELAHARGMRGWVHTCGRMNRLIQMGTYDRMAVDILESLSHPPLGDVADLREARARLGANIVTRGAVNVSLFYSENLEEVRERTREVLENTRGYRHMIGDTNDSYPPYPRENILAVVDEVRKSGRMLEAL